MKLRLILLAVLGIGVLACADSDEAVDERSASSAPAPEASIRFVRAAERANGLIQFDARLDDNR